MLGATGDTSAGDESGTINKNIAELNAMIDAIIAARVAAGIVVE